MRLGRRTTRPLNLLPAILFAAACGANPTGVEHEPSLPVMLKVVSGAEQVGVPGQKLRDPLVARVVTESGTAVSGRTVTFQVVAGGGRLSQTSVVSDGDGMVNEHWVLGLEPSEQIVEARVTDPGSGQSTVFARFKARPVQVRAVSVTPETAQLPVGDTARLQATVTDNQGNTVAVAVDWSSLDSQVASVDSTGRVTAVGTGSARVVAKAGNANDTATVSVTPAAAPVAAGTRVALKVVRLDGGSGTALVSSGIPLAPGMLRPSGIKQVRLFVGGKEQSIYVAPLGGPYRDGSVRSVLVQFSASVGSTPLDAELVLGGARGTTDRAKSPTDYTYEHPVPQAIAVPSSSEYLISTGIVGPTIASPASFSTGYESRFTQQSDLRWATESGEWSTLSVDNPQITRNYYDRALFHWAWWVRTGDVEYWKRAAYYLMAYRELYMRPNNCAVQPHQVQVEGLALHYLLTGDEESRRCIGQIADMYSGSWADVIGSTTEKSWMEGRIQSRVLLGHMTAWEVAAPSARGVDWAAITRQDLTRILGTQSADGSYRFVGTCGEQLNFMTGLVNEVMAKYHDTFEADARILPAVRKAVDFLWNTQWVASEGAFQYMSGVCSGQGGTSPAPDLNMLIVHGFGWVYKQTGDATYRQRGDQVFAEGVKRAWFGSNAYQADKQYNESYRSSYQYLALRQ